MERRLRSPKEEKRIKSNALESLHNKKTILFDRFTNFKSRLQPSSSKTFNSKHSEREGMYEKYPIRKNYKNLNTKNPDPQGVYNKNKIKNCELSKVNDRHESRARNEKANKTKTCEDYPTDKKEKLTKKNNAEPAMRKRPHTASPVLQKMYTHSDTMRKKEVFGNVEIKSVMMEQNPKKDNVPVNKITIQKRPNTSIVQNRPHAQNLQNQPFTPKIQNRPYTQTAQNKPSFPNLHFRNQDYSNSRGDKKIQKIVEKVDGSCAFIKTPVTEARNEICLNEKQSNVRRGSNSSIMALQKIKTYIDSIRAKRIKIFKNLVKDSDMFSKLNNQENKLVTDETLEDSSKSNMESEVSIMSNRPQSAAGKLQSQSGSLNNFVDEMERSFLNKNFTSSSTEKRIDNNFLKVPNLESIIYEKKKMLKNKAVRPQSANGLLQKTDYYSESYRNFVDEMERCYPRYNFCIETGLHNESIENLLDKPNADKQVGRKVNYKNKCDNKITNGLEFDELNQKLSFEDDWILENVPKKSKSLSHLKDSLDFAEDNIKDTSNSVLQEKIERYVKVCVPDMCGKNKIKNIEDKVDYLERIINAKLKLGTTIKNKPNAFLSLYKNDEFQKASSAHNAPNKYISNAGHTQYVDGKIKVYEKKYSNNFCNKTFIRNLQIKVDCLQKRIDMILNAEKPSCQDAQCFTSDLSVKMVDEPEQSEVWETAIEEFEIKKSSISSNLDKMSFKSLEKVSSKPQVIDQRRIQTNLQVDKPVDTIEDARRVLAKAQNLFNPQKVSRVKSSTAIENSRQKVFPGMNKNFSLITTKNSPKSGNIEEYKNFLRKYKIVKVDDLKSDKTQSLPTSNEVMKNRFSTNLNTDATTSSHSEEMYAKRHVEVIENLQKRIEHFKKSSRISELRSKIDEIKSSILQVTHIPQNSALEMDSNNVSVICAVTNYLEESDSAMETSCQDLVKVSEDKINLNDEVKLDETQVAFCQSSKSAENYERKDSSAKLISVSERNSRCTFSPKRKCFRRAPPRPKSAKLKYSKTAFGDITKIIKDLQSRVDQHEKFYQSCNQVASAITNDKLASFERNCSNGLFSSTDVDVKEIDVISEKAIKNLMVKVDSLTETCTVSNIRELQAKLDNIEKACSVVSHADVIKTLQAKIKKLETALENQANFGKMQDSTESLCSCCSSKTFTDISIDSHLSKNSDNLFDEMPACTYCMAVTLDNKQNILNNWNQK